MSNLPPKPDLADQAARDAILRRLEENLIVEAAAGTGKTTSLVGRILNLFASGALSGPARLAAVTFTQKAAGELRSRLQEELERRLQEPGLPGEIRRNLNAAAQNLPECHIGTIHSFCARLLRERPVEAGVNPDFRECEDEDDLLLRRQAWSVFCRELTGNPGQAPHYETFRLFGLDLDTLGAGFEKFADFPDIGHWPGLHASLDDINLPAFVGGVADYQASLGRIAQRLDEADTGTDELLPILRLLNRRFPRLVQPLGLDQAHQLAALFKGKPRFTQKSWREALEMEKNSAGEEYERYQRFFADTVRPFQTACLAAVYARALEVFIQARDVYDRLRRDAGVLNFQDLLMKTAALLRDYPEVRRDLANRYRRLLVDEVQDTDPVQAEIMFLLAAENGRERDWRKCRPRPGALFIVGDPKQSIYRFRRADIVVYQEMKNCLLGHGGASLALQANFRSQPEVIAWINQTFTLDEREGVGEADPDQDRLIAQSGKFSRRESPYSPAYVPLTAGRPAVAAAADCFQGVYRLELLREDKEKGVARRDIPRDEARRIARFIRHALTGGLSLPGPDGPRAAVPGDFMIVTPGKAASALYGAALRQAGVPCRVSGGGTLADSPALALLREYLRALANPDDAVLLLAVLRGGLFGFSDADLYAWKKAGGNFSLLTEKPDPTADGADSEPAAAAAVGRAIAGMQRHARRLAGQLPAAALREVAEDLGLWAYGGLGEDPATGAGVLEAALQLVESEGLAAATLGKTLERLEWLIDNYEQEALPARERLGTAVRVMNVHKTKGLEAPVVFLASTREVREHGATFAVRREGGEGTAGMALAGGPYNSIPLAQGADWEELKEEEALFLAAEKTRLNYVAATRAGAALIVGMHAAKGKNDWKSAFLPPGTVIDRLLPEPPPEAESLTAAESLTEAESGAVVFRLAGDEVLREIDPALLDQGKKWRDQAREKMLTETFARLRAKDGGDFLLHKGVPEGTEGDASERLLAYGELLHRLLESAASDRLAERAAELFGEYGFPAEGVAEALELLRQVRESELWRRLEKAERVFREAPFTLRLQDGEFGAARVERGVIDLAFREGGAWVIVDYKLGSASHAGDFRRMAELHRRQVTAYARAWEKVTGEQVKETGVFFIHWGKYVPLAAE